MALLCLISKISGQSQLITFPVEGSVFQASAGNVGTYAFTFGGQAKDLSGLKFIIIVIFLYYTYFIYFNF